MNEIEKSSVVLQIGHEIESLSKLDVPQLRQELARSLELSASIVIRMAAIIRLLEEKGEDLSDLRFGLMTHLRRVAYGQVIPDVIVKYQGYPMLLDRIASLPLPDQRSLSSGGLVKLAVLNTGVGVDYREVDPTLMTREEIHQAFSRGALRTEPEQVQFIRNRVSAIKIEFSENSPASFGNESGDDPFRSAINEFIRRSGITLAEFCRRAGVGYQAASKYLDGRGEIRSGNLRKLTSAAGIRLIIGEEK